MLKLYGNSVALLIPYAFYMNVRGIFIAVICTNIAQGNENNYTDVEMLISAEATRMLNLAKPPPQNYRQPLPTVDAIVPLHR